MKNLHEITAILDYPNLFKFDWLDYHVKRNSTKDDVELTNELVSKVAFSSVTEAILKGTFELQEVKRLYRDCGFKEHPKLLNEVVNGANWKAIAVRHGFYQI